MTEASGSMWQVLKLAAKARNQPGKSKQMDKPAEVKEEKMEKMEIEPLVPTNNDVYLEKVSKKYGLTTILDKSKQGEVAAETHKMETTYSMR
jgi:hypothetical protein